MITVLNPCTTGLDYNVSLPAQLMLQQDTGEIDITILSDNVLEAQESVVFQLVADSSTPPGVNIDPTFARVMVLIDDNNSKELCMIVLTEKHDE